MADYFKPLRGQVFVTDLERGVRKTAAGILLPADDMTEAGIRHRWARIAYLGEDVPELSVGEWILLPHGRWTNRIEIKTPEGKKSIWKADRDAILLVSDRPDVDEMLDSLPPLN